MADNYLEKKMEELRSGVMGGTQRHSASSSRNRSLLKALRVVVTGGAGLIGSEIVRAFRREGSPVDFIDIDERRGESLAREYGARVHNVDISDSRKLAACISEILDYRGDIDVIVNCAATVDFVPLAENTPERFMLSLQTNVLPAFEIARQLLLFRNSLPFQNPYGGRIINICSTRAYQSEPGTENYSASKGALMSLTHSLMMSMSTLGFTVNSISPGWIAKPDETLTDEDKKQHPSSRVGRPADIARACVFLSLPANNFINGTDIPIDGGMTHKMIYVENAYD